MGDDISSEANQLWKRIGLEELRKSLATLKELSQRFETSLERLPSCNQCACAALLEQIQQSADQLARIVQESIKRGGALIIPAFAVGRTQELT